MHQPRYGNDSKRCWQSTKSQVFRDCEFPPYHPDSDVKFNINVEPGAQIPASPFHKLAPALVENLRKMLQELLHNGLIVPTSSLFALLLVKSPTVLIVYAFIIAS